MFAQPQAETVAQQPDVWMTIQELPVGTGLRLTSINGLEVTGQLVEVRPDAVVVEEKGIPREGMATRWTIRRANVLSVDVVSPPAEKPEKHMSNAAKIAIVAGVGVAVALFMAAMSAGAY